MRKLVWLAVVAAIWLAAVHRQAGPAPLSQQAPAASFSAVRAEAMLARVLGPARPHPAGSEENAALHARLKSELAAMGIAATDLTGMSCRARTVTIACGTVDDVIAPVLPGEGKAVLLMAHLDSVAAGPGAGDDGIGVATLLETLRALKAAPQRFRRPVTALFTDGEEAGLLGAEAFVRDPAWRARIGVAINVDARGDAGQSLLFQASPGDADLIGLYAKAVPRPAAGSLYAAIYKLLPNDTDLTPFLRAGLPGVNFANIGHVAAYHTAIDTLAAVDPRTLQSQGDNVLAMTRALADADFARLESGNAIYLDVLGLWLPRLGVGWAIPLAVLSFAVAAILFWRRRDGFALAMPPLLLAGSMAAGVILQKIAALISGHADPAYARPWLLGPALALGAWAVALGCAGRASIEATWLWLSGLALVAAIFLPGASPYWLFPALVAAATLPFAAHRSWLAAVPALGMLLIWIPLMAQVQTLLGLAMPLGFVFCLAMALVPLLPLLGRGRQGALVAGVLALALAVAAGFVAPFDAAHPQRLNLVYAERGGAASYRVEGTGPVPEAMRRAANFSQRQPYIAAAGAAVDSPPSVKIARQAGEVTLDLQDRGAVTLTVPQAAGLRAVTIGAVTVPAPAGAVTVACATPDCGHFRFRLRLASRAPVTIGLRLRRTGLPPQAARLLKSRPAFAVPWQSGDVTVRIADLKIPGG